MSPANPGGLHPPERGEVGGPEAHSLHPGARGCDLLEVHDAERGLEDGVHHDRPPDPRLGLELGQQAIDVMDVPGPLDLGDHDHLDLVAHLGDDARDVVEHPGALQRVHAGPDGRVAEVVLADGLDEPLTCGLLLVHRDGVLEVSEEDVRLRRDVRRLCGHLLVREVEEVDHPRGLQRDLGRRVRGSDRERLGELAGIPHGAEA
jgi:hypothetical protein